MQIQLRWLTTDINVKLLHTGCPIARGLSHKTIDYDQTKVAFVEEDALLQVNLEVDMSSVASQLFYDEYEKIRELCHPGSFADTLQILKIKFGLNGNYRSTAQELN